MDLIRSTIDLETRVQVMGVLNVTPDSFSDGGRYQERARAVERALAIEAEGADLLDLGGESTRPGSKAVPPDEQCRRVLPVLESLAGRLRIPLSIDTTSEMVARAAVAAGAEIINDVSGLRFEPALADAAAETGAALVLMHSRGTPETMQTLPPMRDLFAEVIADLDRAVNEALRRGVPRTKLLLDPGIGFGKTVAQNLQLIQGLDRLRDAFGLPILLGASRKSFLLRVLDDKLPAAVRDEARERAAGTAASIALGILRGARVVRVHDIPDMLIVTRLMEAFLQNSDSA